MKESQPKRSRKRKADKDHKESASSFAPPPVQPDPGLLPLLGSTPPIAEGPKVPRPVPPIVAKFIEGNPKNH